MFVIEREGHLGFWWDGEKEIFLEDKSWVFPSRSSCLEYLQKFHSMKNAVDIIMMIKKGNGKIYSF